MQECTLRQILIGDCSFLDMLTGEVLVGIGQIIVAIVAVWVAVRQIKKQEELTRQQIDATLKTTQIQLEEMRKSSEPEIDIILSEESSVVLIELFNAKHIPIYLRGFDGKIIWGDPESLLSIWDIEEIYPGLIDFPKNSRKVLKAGQSFHITIDNYFFRLMLDPDFFEITDYQHHGDKLTKENLQWIIVYIWFDIPGVEAAVCFTYQRKGTSQIFKMEGRSVPANMKGRRKVIEREYEIEHGIDQHLRYLRSRL